MNACIQEFHMNLEIIIISQIVNFGNRLVCTLITEERYFMVCLLGQRMELSEATIFNFSVLGLLSYFRTRGAIAVLLLFLFGWRSRENGCGIMGEGAVLFCCTILAVFFSKQT
jgi:hypothetical protein